jgi:hypothetical protein
MVMSQGQSAGCNHNMKTDISSFERVEQFKYLEANLMDQNSIQKEIKSRLKLWNACYFSVQNLLSSSLLSKNLKIYRTITLPVRLYGCETWSIIRFSSRPASQTDTHRSVLYQMMYWYILALLMMSTCCSKHVEAWNKYVKKE